MNHRTALYDLHLEWGAKMVPFAGWDMPLHYGSQIAEHHAVRRGTGLFDVSHMAVVDIAGPDARLFLRRLFANDVAKLERPGQALYSCMLNEAAGIIDDLIAYLRPGGRYRLVMNAGNRERDLAWLRARAGNDRVHIRERHNLAILALQGPGAEAILRQVLDKSLGEAAAELDPFCGVWKGEWLVARTGYTGEDGYELILPNTAALELATEFCAAGAVPVGLGARDTLRLEAALNLHGSDMDESVNPLETGLGWTVAWEPEEREFVGRRALAACRERGAAWRRAGLILDGPGIPRGGQAVLFPNAAKGVVTSGGFSPTLAKGIALARIPTDCVGADTAEIEIRGRKVLAHRIRPPFVTRGAGLQGEEVVA